MKLRCAALLVSVVSLAGCDKVVSTQTFPETAFIVKDTQSCAGPPGWCVACGLNLDGSFDCAPKFKYSCPGTQPVTVRLTDAIQHHKSGKVSTHQIRETLSVDGECV